MRIQIIAKFGWYVKSQVYKDISLHTMYKTYCRGFLMKKYIEDRAIEIANYIIESNATVRQAAKKFGISNNLVNNCNIIKTPSEEIRGALLFYIFLKATKIDKYL